MLNQRCFAAGMKKPSETPSREHRTSYEVHRHREPGNGGVLRSPVVESFDGLDRSRLAALSYALDGPTSTGDRFSGLVEVYRILRLGEKRADQQLVDAIDERVAFRLLNEIVLPRADQLSVSVESLQEQANRLSRLGF